MKAPCQTLVTSEIGAKQLEGDHLAILVASAEDLPHRALAERRIEGVLADLLTRFRHRPLTIAIAQPGSNDDPLTEIRTKLRARTAYYRELADLQLDTSGLAPGAVAQSIVDHLPAG